LDLLFVLLLTLPATVISGIKTNAKIVPLDGLHGVVLECFRIGKYVALAGRSVAFILTPACSWLPAKDTLVIGSKGGFSQFTPSRRCSLQEF
jgi:hypothetical protein